MNNNKPGGTTYTPPERPDFKPRQLNVPQFKEKLKRSWMPHLPFEKHIERVTSFRGII